MDLSKAYGHLSQDLLIAKLEAYGLDIGNLNFGQLSLRNHRTKVGFSYSKKSEICRRISQGSITDPLYSSTVFFYFVEKSEICNFADGNATYLYEKYLSKIKEDLICTLKNILEWFRLNSLKINTGKILGDKTCNEHVLKVNLFCV